MPMRAWAGTASKRRHLEDMVEDLPARSLIVADTGFCGYWLCQDILHRGDSV
jgi:hypothetical protein